ncbi:MAG: hydrolase [Sphingomonadales bacterium RIFCSPHIGHO2_01_FULL_65_20]|jgi:spore germination cell wall hydrolase CwlJ-like protein|uniref:Cell wall hydrolase n=1 Tax=Sphingomonas ursincola TaxID=56361 RepID=A0A7V8RCQ7_9SPHN|nr:cell wall hydrolase [Sphingomonas ursincola]MBA1374053.1 cell wall hydrolase [Sphingomonas ursincola]MBY0621455.1 cell wall hydrolase [Sphingomonas ursincola]MCH2237445.1 cell wall hydrolase [Blastomonas sp.]OHC93263.1 MAG: hydrolase [Sphingomonadales bacterium RIFCSPHIGHO2_01_FULL_65_20]
MSKILKVASMAAMTVYSIVTFSLTDASAALASPLIADMIQPVPAQTSETTASSADEAAVVAGAASAETAPQQIDTQTAQPPLKAESLAQLVSMSDMPAEIDEETRCLAGAVYFESKGETLNGQLAVAKVVIARRDSGRFASSLCGVVYQPSQFSFVRGGRMPAIPTASQDWKEAVAIAQIAMKDSWDSPVEGALFFHARHVSPGWRMQRLAAVDNHVFYR